MVPTSLHQTGTDLPPALALEIAQLLQRATGTLPTETEPEALDVTTAFVRLCALLTDPDVQARRDACCLLASVPRVPAQRLFVHSSVYDEFVRKATAKAASRKVGDPFGEVDYAAAMHAR